MSVLKQYNFWLITGSQNLYGEEAIRQVNANAADIADALNRSRELPCQIIAMPAVTTPEAITKACKDADYDDSCAGIITWMHTFSPSKMWIAGLSRLQKPLLHFHTQHNREIPWGGIDMDFMNLNQSAHGDREHGFIGARLRLPRKIVAGYYEDTEVRRQIAQWQRCAVGVAVGKTLKVARFGDNMREVAVTEGDKIEAQLRFGWSVNYYGIGDLAAIVHAMPDDEIAEKLKQYDENYLLATDRLDHVRYQARLELGIRRFLEQGGLTAYTTNFEDLHGLEQLPGLASQQLMADGFGFGAEGDWKTAALTRVMKVMAEGLPGGTSFMEDYTYHLEKGNELVLGSHMLEVCPSLAAETPSVEVHALGIGGKNAPARLVFHGGEGPAVAVSLVDMGGRMRMIACDVEAVAPPHAMPNLPTAHIMWRPLPSLSVSAQAWLLSGGAHHTVFTHALTAEHMRDFARMTGLEFVHIGAHTSITELEKELLWNDIAYKFQ
ncbi:MAG: L-arabinose isomerase [Oscillospiraceae bacterium]|jgi:L-arabinose isomerase|nr:L-arabinose isomerase [Oscillospiraceae bacterium]